MINSGRDYFFMTCVSVCVIKVYKFHWEFDLFSASCILSVLLKLIVHYSPFYSTFLLAANFEQLVSMIHFSRKAQIEVTLELRAC